MLLLLQLRKASFTLSIIKLKQNNEEKKIFMITKNNAIDNSAGDTSVQLINNIRHFFDRL